MARGGGGCPRLSPLRSRAEQTEAARERKRRREEEEEGLPERSRHSPSPKQRTMDLVCPSPLITAQRLGAGFPLPHCPSLSLLSFPVPLSLPVPPVPVPSRWPPPRSAPRPRTAAPSPRIPGAFPPSPSHSVIFTGKTPPQRRCQAGMAILQPFTNGCHHPFKDLCPSYLISALHRSRSSLRLRDCVYSSRRLRHPFHSSAKNIYIFFLFHICSSYC